MQSISTKQPEQSETDVLVTLPLINASPKIAGADSSNIEQHDHSSKVLVVGMDSADWDVLGAFFKIGRLPNIQRLIKRGSSFNMRSTVPDMTPPAWTTFVTGVNPGRHNVYGFFQPFGGSIKLTNVKTRRAPSMWESMNPNCVKLLVNIPMTNPVTPLNGCMISDSLTSVDQENWVWPQSEKENLINQGYKACMMSRITDVKKLDQLLVSSSIRGEAFIGLMDRYDPCFSMIVFSETDWVQHLFPGDQDSILKVYEKVDQFLGRLMERIEQECLILVASDHGYGVARKKFLVNNWLIRSGLLTVRTSNSVRKKIANEAMKGARFGGRYIFKAIPRSISLKMATSLPSPSQDLSSLSGVYHIGWDLGQFLRLHITDDCRERYDEYFEKILNASQSLIDEKNGRKPIKRIFKKSELYSGPYIFSAPDFVIELDPLYSGNERILTASGILLDYKAGIHRDTGILVSCWVGTNEPSTSERKTIRISDIAPSILSLMGARPRKTDGRMIPDIVGDSVHS